MTAAVAFTNLLDDADVSASGSNALTPPSNVQDEQVGTKWSVNSSTAYLLFDCRGDVEFDTIMFDGVTGTDPVFQLRLSSVDASGAAGDVDDTGSIQGLPYFDPNYGKFVYLYATPLTARYVRLDQSEGGVARTAAGRAFGGMRETFGLNFQAPWTRTPIRRSTYTEGEAGGSYIDRRRGLWKINASFGFLSETDRTGFLEQMAVRVVNEGHLDFLWINDVDSTNLSRDCIWGFQEPSEQPVTQNLYTVPPVFNVEFPVRQRR